MPPEYLKKLQAVAYQPPLQPLGTHQVSCCSLVRRKPQTLQSIDEGAMMAHHHPHRHLNVFFRPVSLQNWNSSGVTALKAQQDPQEPWFLTAGRQPLCL